MNPEPDDAVDFPPQKQFPKPSHRPEDRVEKRYRCVVCGRVTDQSKTCLFFGENDEDVRKPNRHVVNRKVCPGVKEPTVEFEVIVR